ncbi:MFS transporter [Paenibacillus sp. IHBB 10380]|uniref:MFS transporter n=1 Tax=Paenibacillus sp. IHBB 10380 TaxID=1566358 RepID=UPI0005CFB19B|nr:MFS transporter [Paenibacillus sp. IHBB 10380]AJS60996.1 fucose permease [Paenibacillus sp. IHBB 10380]
MKRLIWIGCLSYFLIGLAHVVLGSVLPVILEHYDREYSEGGQLIFAQFAGFLGGVMLSPWLNRRLGKKGSLLLALVALFIAESVYTLLPPWEWMYVTGIVAGFGFGMIEAVIGTIIITGVTHQTAVAMSRLEVFFGVGAMLMPLLASGMIYFGWWRWSFLVVSLFALITFIFWAKGSFGALDSILNARNVSPQQPKQPKVAVYHKGQKRTLAIFVVFFFLYVGVEMSLANFMPSMLVEKMSMDKAGAALSVTFFWIAMSIGRLFAGYIAEKIRYRSYVLISSLSALILLTLFPFTNQIWSAFTVITLLGLFMSGLFSITLVFANKLMPGTEESTTSILIAAGGVGGAVLPLIIGWCMDHLVVNQTAGMLAVFTVGLFLLSIAAFRAQHRYDQTVQGYH